MKKIFVLVVIIIFFQKNIFGQLSKNTWLVGGNLSFASSIYHPNQSAETKTSDFQLSATVGYFITPRLPIGIRTMFQTNKQNYKDAFGTTGEAKANYLSVGPFVRYYFLKKIDPVINFFGEANYLFGKARPDISANTFSFYRYYLLAGPVVYFNSSVGLELTLGYYYQKPNDGRNATSGFQTGLGFQIYLEKAK